MANPSPQPLPTVGGSYLLNESTGEWVRQDGEEPAAPEPFPVDESHDDQAHTETPAAGEV